MRLVLALLMTLPAPVAAQDAALVELATRTLGSLQDISFRKRREYCGFFGYNAAGELVASAAQAGTHDSCAADWPDDLALVASYHTHGAFDRGYFNEVPSPQDIESDAAFYLDGFVSTPGGRLWFVDGRAREAFQICASGCLPVAPGFFKGLNGPIATHYTYDDIVELMAD